MLEECLKTKKPKQGEINTQHDVQMLLAQDTGDRENKHNQVSLEAIVRRSTGNGQLVYVNVFGIHLHDCVNEW